jgi:hypothetical protein
LRAAQLAFIFIECASFCSSDMGFLGITNCNFV